MKMKIICTENLVLRIFSAFVILALALCIWLAKDAVYFFGGKAQENAQSYVTNFR